MASGTASGAWGGQGVKQTSFKELIAEGGTHAQVEAAGADVSRMTARHTTLLGAKAPIRNQQRPQLDEAHWRTAAQEAVRRADKHWQIPLENITEIALSDADGPCYLFKVLYTDDDGTRFTAAVHVPKDMDFISPLSIAALMPGEQRGSTLRCF